MIGVGVEMSTRCRACSTVVPVNAIAPEVSCGECARVVSLSRELWTMVLRDAASRGSGLPDNHEVASSLAVESGTFRVVLRRCDPLCARCGAALALPDRLESGTLACPAGHPVAASALPEGLSVPGVGYTIGEPPRESSSPPEVVVLHCPSCGGPLPADGHTSIVRCGYCQVECTLPDDARKAIRVQRTTRWFVACEARTSPAPLASWSRVAGAAADGRGLVYLVGTTEPGDAEPSVFCVDASMNLRWVRRALPHCSPRGARIAVRGDFVIVGEPGQMVVYGLRALDGDAAFTFPSAARATPLPIDLRASLGVAFDADGSALVSVKGAAWGGQVPFALFYRLTPQGELAPTWPGSAPTAPPEIGTRIPALEAPPSSPVCLTDHPGVFFGADEHVYFCASGMLVKFDRMGRWHRSFPSPRGDSWEDRRAGVDARGTVHALTGEALLRIDAGGQLESRIERRRGGGPIGDETLLAVAPDGTSVLVGNDSRLRVLGPDGRVLSVSPASRAADGAA